MKILEICVDLDGGGIDRYLLNYCSRIKGIDFDFVIVDNNKVGVLEKPIADLGCHIYKVERQSKGVIRYYKTLKKIMTENQYDAAHIHLGYRGCVALLCAKMCGIKCRISHAHIAFEPESSLRKLIRKVCTLICKMLSTNLAACGIDAAKWLWGENEYKNGKVTIHNNAIDGNKFRYSEEYRKKVRKELNLTEDTVAVGHVGRLCAQKNQLRLLEIFLKIKELNPDSMLYMVGRGELEKTILQKAKQLGIENSIVLLGIRDDVYELLNAFDVFVFPSTHEGLPFTLIETQCNGLKSLSADTVTELVKVSDCVEFMTLDEQNANWAKRALALANSGHDANAYRMVADAGYDINEEAKRLKKYYEECIRFVNNG